MSDTKTEWAAAPMVSHTYASDRWRVIGGKPDYATIADCLDRDTAHRIAAVNELEAALQDCLDDLADRNHCKGYASATAALSKARGET